MKWDKDGPTAFTSPDGKHTISRSPQEGFGADGLVTYMLVTGGEIVAVERDVYDSPEERLAAVRRLRAVCGA